MILEKGSSIKYLQDYRDGKIKQGLGLGCDLDKHFRFKTMQYNGILGGDNVGKTYFVLWYMLALSSQHDLKWCLWMDENTKGQSLRDLIQMYAGVKYMDLSHNDIQKYSMKIENWFCFVDNEPSYKPDELLKLFETVDCDGYFIDPFNQLDHDMQYASNIKFIRDLKRWCKNKKKTVFLSMHPVTSVSRKQGEYPKEHDWAGHPMSPKKGDAEGGKIFSNMSDDWINVHRLTKHPTMKFYTMIDVDKVKVKDTGGQQNEMNSPTLLEYNYGLGFKINGIDPIKRNHTVQRRIEPSKDFSEPQRENKGIEFNDNQNCPF